MIRPSRRRYPVKIYPVSRFSIFQRLCAGGIALIALTMAAPAAQEPVEPVDAHAEEFKVLDLDMVRFETLFHQYNNLLLKPSILSQLQTLKDRVEALRLAFDRSKFDELRSDINLQAQRLALAMAPLRTPPVPKTDRSHTLNLARLNPRPNDKAEVKAALEAVDAEIRRLERHVPDLGLAERPAEQARIKRFKDRRDQLGKEFSKAGWDGLVGELK